MMQQGWYANHVYIVIHDVVMQGYEFFQEYHRSRQLDEYINISLVIKLSPKVGMVMNNPVAGLTIK